MFDGHGPYGHRVACYVRDHLPSKLTSKLNSLQVPLIAADDCQCDSNGNDADATELCSWKSTFVKVFEELDKELRNHASIDCICSGSTAVSIVKQVLQEFPFISRFHKLSLSKHAVNFFQKEHLIIANLGDSRAILCSRGDNDQLVPVQLTVDLKPNLPSQFTDPNYFLRIYKIIYEYIFFFSGEEERITSCRGRVFALAEEPGVHRIWLPDEDCPGLAMARAFGDFCLKDFGLISTPQVSCRKLSEKDELVVLATDGVSSWKKQI